MSSLNKFKRKLKDLGKTTTEDRISNLPNNVTQQILECLPLKEAVKTSILSSHWRYKWASTTQLIFDRTFCRSIMLGKGEHSISSEYSKAVDNILFSHVGPVSKFVLYLPEWFTTESDKISQWIRFFRANGVKEFTLVGDLFLTSSRMLNMPTCLFSCVGLTHLALYHCCDNLSIPPTFRGFPFLKSLKLLNRNDLNTSISPKNGLENLISKCPSLECLYTTIRDLAISLTIRAPKLQELVLCGYMKGLSWDQTMVIKTLDLSIYSAYYQNSRSKGAFFSYLPKVENLILGGNLWRAIRCYQFTSPNKFPKELESLQNLRLLEIPTHCCHSMSFVLSLLRNSPNLEQLYLVAEKCEGTEEVEVGIDGSWKCNLKFLKSVQLMNISGLKNELLLIKFILASSYVLRRMTVAFGTNLVGAEEKYRFAKELMQYSRASPHAHVIFKDKEFGI